MAWWLSVPLNSSLGLVPAYRLALMSLILRNIERSGCMPGFCVIMKLGVMGRLKVFHPRILLLSLSLVTIAVSFILFQTTKSNPAGYFLPKYSLTLDVKGIGGVPSFSIVHSCLSADSSFLCKPKRTPVKIFPGVFSTLNLSSDVASGHYDGIRVRINGNKGNFFYVKSISLQGKTVFDGKDFSVFKNVQGMQIARDQKTNLSVFSILSDSASFEFDCGFTAAARGTTVKYTKELSKNKMIKFELF